MSQSIHHELAQLIVGPCPAARRVRGLWYAFAALPPEVRAGRIAAVCRAIARGEMSWDGLLEARRAQRIVGGLWCYAAAGRHGFLCSPSVVAGEADAEVIAHELLVCAEQYLTQQGTKSLQAFVAPDAVDDARRLESHGFRRVATILTLRREVTGDVESSLNAESPLNFEPYEPARPERLARLIARTYEGSLDCPALDGARGMDDVLASYQGTGSFSPDRWLIACHNHDDIGCVLLADHPEENQWELIYMGLVPAARGNGWGTHLVARAIQLCGRAERPHLIVAVDEANFPAVAMYERAGFTVADRQVAFVRVLATENHV